MGEPGFLECLEDIWDRDAEEGIIEFAFDPATQQRSNVTLNPLTASLAGMHKEEVLAWMKETRARKKEEQQDKDNLAKEMQAIEKAAREQ